MQNDAVKKNNGTVHLELSTLGGRPYQQRGPMATTTKQEKKKRSLTSTGSPATALYAMLCGIDVSATVNPESRSIHSACNVYVGSHT